MFNFQFKQKVFHFFLWPRWVLSKFSIFKEIYKKISHSLTLISLWGMVVASFAQVEQIHMEGNFHDWDSYIPLYTDPNDDQSGGNIDFGSLWATNDEGFFFLRIELGGEILASGKNLEQDKEWLVGIENVESDLENRSFVKKVALLNMAMASSGNYRKFRIDTITGEKYVHTINPLTGKAEKSDLTSASVLASSCAYADAYATAFMAMGLERSREVLNDLEGIEVYLTYTNQDDVQQVFMTEGFKRHLRE